MRVRARSEWPCAPIPFPRYVGVGSGECRVITLDVAGRFADDFQISNDRILDQPVDQKC
jgi:hypothetical protein